MTTTTTTPLTATTYTCWAGYLPDHTFEDDETNCTYHEARLGVLDALDDEGSHAAHEAVHAETDQEYGEWAAHAEDYRVAIAILEQTPVGAPFDVTIRGERFAVVETR